jgi:ABC-type multidrug transport system fused ATPase/permease subunit
MHHCSVSRRHPGVKALVHSSVDPISTWYHALARCNPDGYAFLASKRKLINMHAGRILNRLSRDMEVLDSSLSNSLRAVIFRLATFIASVLTVTYVFPAFLLPATVISYLYYRISKGYINAGRDMRRMQSTTRSPIFAAFAETLEGIVTVRAFGAERHFLSILLRRIDLTTKVCISISLCVRLSHKLSDVVRMVE